MGTWTAGPNYPINLTDAGCAINSGTIYCVGSDNSINMAARTAYYAPVSGAGFGTWKSTNPDPIGFGMSGCSIENNYIYCIGSENVGNNQVYYAPVSASGIGTWSSSNTVNYPLPMTDTGCVVDGGYIYCVGSQQVSPHTQVYYANISTAGVSAWTQTTSYPIPFDDAYCAVPGYGGGFMGGGGPNTGPANGGPYFVNVIVTNAYPSASTAPFQQMLTINSLAYQSYINSNWSNVEFTTGPAATGSAVQAWIEANPSNAATNTLVWVNIPGGVPANGNTTIYMNFMPNIVMSSSGPTGEAPQLSNPSYGLYDNGALAFPTFYDNFAGKTINPAWDTNGADGSYSVNNGLTLQPNGITGCAFTLNNAYLGQLAVDTYQYAAPVTKVVRLGSSFSNWQTWTSPCDVVSGAYQEVDNPGDGSGMEQYLVYPGAGGMSVDNPSTIDTDVQQVTSLAVSSANAIAYQDYNNSLSQAAAYNILLGNTYPGIMAGSDPDVMVYVTWFRIRSYPPDNVTPSVSYGPVTH